MRKYLNLFVMLAVVVSASVAVNFTRAADTTEVVMGDTSSGENMPGWMFNRDGSTATPYVFNTDAASIGTGSIYIEPISANASDKFIAENFINAPIVDVDSITYDFKIGTGGEEADKVHFYMNVYANFGDSDPFKFYDCRYNIVPTVGSLAGFTTVTFDPTMAYPVTQSGSAVHTCPAIPAEMDLEVEGSTIRVFALNVGDTSGSDEGLDGYLDKVVVTMGDDSVTYDFEPFTRSAEILSPTADEVVTDGSLELAAVLNDDDTLDSVQWAVRSGTCAAGTGTVAGNVDGYSDIYSWDAMSFSATLDVSEWTNGDYCFVFNPTESAGESNIRLTQNFSIDNETTPGPTVPMTKDECKNGGWMTFTDPSFKNQGQCVSYVATRQHQ